MPYRLRHMRKRERKLILWYCRWVLLQRYFPAIFILKFGLRAGFGAAILHKVVPCCSVGWVIVLGGALALALLTQKGV